MAEPQSKPKPAPEHQPIPPAKPANDRTEVGALPDVSQLTPEEQMALFEKDLKENDCGHRPC